MEYDKHTFVVLAYKESEYLEECLKSVLNQDCKTKVIIATSTPNAFIQGMADKYKIPVFQNPQPGQGIGYDFDFARTCADTELVTIAHQDDIYDRDYARSVVEGYEKYKDATILFTDCYEIHESRKVESNKNLKIKRILLTLLRIRKLAKFSWVRRSAIRMGDAICCPAVTFVNHNIDEPYIFACDFKCDVDWHAWEMLSRKKGRFIYIPSKLMGHRVHEDSTTTEIIRDNIRTKEDFIMFCKFWPKPIAKRLSGVYKNSEKSNER